MPRYFYRFAIVFVGLLITTGCRSSHRDLPPNFLVVGIEANPAQLDPRYATDANAVRIGNLIYNSLLRTDEKLRLQPELAERWQHDRPRRRFNSICDQTSNFTTAGR